jgi:taurine--2-oxoglutarate transaminase
MDVSKDDIEKLKKIDKDHVLTYYSMDEGYDPTVFVTGKGCHVQDIYGKEYLDFMARSHALLVGYQDPRVIAAIKKQADTLCFTDTANLPKIQLTKRLIDMVDGRFERVFYSNSGGAAAEAAINAARIYKNASKVFSFWRSFHGTTFLTLSADGNPHIADLFKQFVPGHLKIPPPYCYRCFMGLNYPECGLKCADIFEQYIRWEGKNDVAALIAEPVLNGGIVPPPTYWPKIKEICDTYGVVLIIDEIATAFGRTGKVLAMDHWGVTPDIVALSKGLASGYLPLSATLFTSEISEFFRTTYFPLGYTYEGHPLCCAAAVANLDVILEDKLIERAARTEKYVMEALKGLKESHQCIGDVRGIGLFFGIELVKNVETREPFVPYDTPIHEIDIEQAANMYVEEKAMEKGLIIGTMPFSSTLELTPPLTVTEEEIDTAVHILDEVLSPVDHLCE